MKYVVLGALGRNAFQVCSRAVVGDWRAPLRGVEIWLGRKALPFCSHGVGIGEVLGLGPVTDLGNSRILHHSMSPGL